MASASSPAAATAARFPMPCICWVIGFSLLAPVRASDRSDIVALRHERKLGGVAEQAILGAADGAGLLERGERRVDLRAAGAEQQGELALGVPELQRQPPSGRRLPVAERNQKEFGQPHLQRIKRNCFELVADVTQPATQERNHGIADRWMARAQLTKCASLQEVGRHRRQCGRLCAARPAIEQRDFAEYVAGDGDLEAQLAPPGSRGRETNLPFGEQIEVRARIAAREQQLTLVETGLAKA